jgi:pyruvate formate lyase activating enzyme
MTLKSVSSRTEDNWTRMEIKGFLETSFLDWPGSIASVIFLAGCNFRCPFCHNHGLVTNHDAYPSLSWSDIKARLSRFRGWIDGVVITGGEPTLSPGLADLIEDIKAAGFGVKLDTNGSRPEVIRDLMDRELLDHVAMDVKGPLDDVSYARAAGRTGFLQPVRDSLELLAKSGLPYTLRTTVVPHLHTEQDIFRMAEQLKNVPVWVLQNFKPDNALDSSFRCFSAWDQSFFNDLLDRVAQVRRGAA